MKRTKILEGMNAGIRAANLAMFIIRKQGVMPNSSWQAGFEEDMATATRIRDELVAEAGVVPTEPETK